MQNTFVTSLGHTAMSVQISWEAELSFATVCSSCAPDMLHQYIIPVGLFHYKTRTASTSTQCVCSHQYMWTTTSQSGFIVDLCAMQMSVQFIVRLEQSPHLHSVYVLVSMCEPQLPSLGLLWTCMLCSCQYSSYGSNKHLSRTPWCCLLVSKPNPLRWDEGSGHMPIHLSCPHTVCNSGDWPCLDLISHGQIPFHTEGKSLGHGHRTVCCPHQGVCTNHSTILSHILPDVRERL